MTGPGGSPLGVDDEYSPLASVIVGLASPYQRDRAKVAAEMSEFPFVPDTARRQEVLALDYPTEEILIREYAQFAAALEKHGAEVLRADAGAAYSFDYTCPRDIGFVVGDRFFIANMAVPSRAQEYRTILGHLRDIDPGKLVRPPADAVIEGGDVVALGARTLLVGINRRTERKGYEFLRDYLAPQGYDVIPVAHNALHLDCCLNPLGLGHLLIHPESLDDNPESTWRALRRYDWIAVDAAEREHLATNVLSLDRDTVVARDHPSCTRVNDQLRERGYTVEAVGFDGVPATGGSFRCATLVLRRETDETLG